MRNKNFIKHRYKKFCRRFRRFYNKKNKKKIFYINQEIIRLASFSKIWLVSNSFLYNTFLYQRQRQALLELFSICVQRLVYYLMKVIKLFLKIIKLMGKYFKRFSTYLTKLILRHPLMTMAFGYFFYAQIIIYLLVTKFKKRIRWYDYFLTLIMYLILFCLGYFLIKHKAFEVILKRFYEGLSYILFLLRKLNLLRFSNEHLHSLPIENTSDSAKPTKDINFKDFLLFVVFITLTTKYSVSRFKKTLVGDGSFGNIVIEIIDADPLHVDNLEKFLKQKKTRA